MSAMSASACSNLLVWVLTRTPSMRETQRWSNTASIATTPSSSPEIAARSSGFMTPAVWAASSAFGDRGSQPPKTRSSSSARGTNSLIRGLRFSSRLPSRMWAICATEPSGSSPVRREWRTPAITVDATAPMPGIKTPSLPVGGAIVRAVVMTVKLPEHACMGRYS